VESLVGRVFAITGASKGMGLRFARALTAEGAKVALLARPSNDLKAAAKEMPESLALECDVTSSHSVNAAFARIEQHFGALHGLINNAAMCLIHKMDDVTDEEIRGQIETNLVGPIFCIRAAIPLMRASGGGDIVNISSESAHHTMPMLTLYGATKAGLESVSRGLGAELAPEGFRVTALRSGTVKESSIGTNWAPERMKQFHEEGAKGLMPAVTTSAVSPETMAGMLIHILKLPREATIDLIELRGS
jgi:meso-butanediol dehydrogenase/(S,S)-butanediol dehydrogenase/diacetyl reductase